LGLELSNATSSIYWIFVPLFDEAHNPKVVSSNLTLEAPSPPLSCSQRESKWESTTVAIRAPESNWRDQAARSLFPPIERTSLQLPTKTGHFKAVFQCFSRVRSTESSEFMERAMGIEL